MLDRTQKRQRWLLCSQEVALLCFLLITSIYLAEHGKVFISSLTSPLVHFDSLNPPTVDTICTVCSVSMGPTALICSKNPELLKLSVNASKKIWVLQTLSFFFSLFFSPNFKCLRYLEMHLGSLMFLGVPLGSFVGLLIFFLI